MFLSGAAHGPERFAPSLLLVSPGSVGGLEGVQHGLRNPAAVGDLVAVLPSPRPDRRGLLPVEWLRPRTGARGHLLRPPAARRTGSATLAAGRDKRRQRVAQPGGRSSAAWATTKALVGTRDAVLGTHRAAARTPLVVITAGGGTPST